MGSVPWPTKMPPENLNQDSLRRIRPLSQAAARQFGRAIKECVLQYDSNREAYSKLIVSFPSGSANRLTSELPAG